jgi:hypothetical protein
MKLHDIRSAVFRRLRQLNKTTRRVLYTAAATCAALLVFLLLPDTYQLSAAVTDTLDLVPEKPVLLLHLASPEALNKRYENSALYERIRNSVAWNNLFASPEAASMLAPFYYLESRTGNVITPRDLPSYCGGSASAAVYPDGTMLAVMRTNLKSRLGISLLRLYRGEPVAEGDISRIDEETSRQEKVLDTQAARQREQDWGAPVNADRTSTLFGESDITLGNLKITRIKSGDGFLYLTLLGDYFFFSDSLPRLTMSLKLAAGKNSAAVIRLPGVAAARTRLTPQSALVYVSGRDSAAAPMVSSLAGDDGLACALHFPDGELARGDVFAAGQPPRAGVTGNAEWQKFVPDGSVLAFSSELLTPARLGKAFESNSDAAKPFNSGISDFWKKAAITPERYFSDKGMVFCFNGVKAADGHLYPLFSLGFGSAQGGDVLLKSMFKTGPVIRENWQNTAYTSYRAGARNWYKPSLLSREGRHFITTDTDSMQQLISAQSGNSPRLAGGAGYGMEPEFAAAPHQLLLDVPRFVDTIRSALYYSADQSSDFGRKTIDTEVMPLLSVLDEVQSMHIALGLAAQHTGSIRLNPRR